MGKKGVSHHRAWTEAREEGVEECFWCEQEFNEDRPPTIDHVQPKSFGGHIGHGIVFACAPCNSARGNIEFDVYLEAVEMEREMSRIEKREYRRPKRRKVRGQWIVTTLPRRQIRLIEQIASIDWVEPSDLAADKRWDREINDIEDNLVHLDYEVDRLTRETSSE